MKTIFYGDPAADSVVIQLTEADMAEEAERVASLLLKNGAAGSLCVAAAFVDGWNGDLSPWPAPPVYGKTPFAGNAENTLRRLQTELLPGIGGERRTLYLGGYSLAGLFALWAGAKTDAFAGIAAASPSVWYPDYIDYARQNPMLAPKVYLSLGNKEEKARNPVMARVGDAIRALPDIFARQGVACTLEWNEGNHFRDPDLRLAKAFKRLIEQL